MLRITRWICALCMIGLVAACGSEQGPTTRTVAASFYPLAWMAERLGGPDVPVADLTPPGAEPHALELTPKGRVEIEEARLVLVMGNGFQPTVESAASRRSANTVVALDEVAVEGTDPHVWLDPVRMRELAAVVAQRMQARFPEHATAIATRADALANDLSALDAEYRAGLATCARRELVTSHEAFGYLARRYDLREVGIAGLSPDDEPAPAQLARITELVRRDGITTVFTEDLVSPKVADALAREVGVTTAELTPIEGLTDAQRSARADYLTLMRANLTALRTGLGCSS